MQSQRMHGVRCDRCSLKATAEQLLRLRAGAGAALDLVLALAQLPLSLPLPDLDIPDLLDKAVAEVAAAMTASRTTTAPVALAAATAQQAVQHAPPTAAGDDTPSQGRLAGRPPARSTASGPGVGAGGRAGEAERAGRAALLPPPTVLRAPAAPTWRSGPALHCSRVVLLPRLLALQLRRTVWDTDSGQLLKVHGCVPIPMELGPRQLSCITQPILQQATPTALPPMHPPHASATMMGSMEMQTHCSTLPVTLDVVSGLAPYRLVAVVVHQGDASSGHYLVFRRVPGSSSGSGGRGSSEGSDIDRWCCVSDRSVRWAQEQEVVGCEASVLLYDRWSETRLRPG
ncbi:hypothetical protein V8C86DRAFT_3134229 [Haematococcus lacustris]